MQGGLGLPDRDYYLSSDPAMAKLRADYTPYVAKMLTLAGFPNAQARAQKIVALEMKIAQAHETLEASQECTTANNPWKRADFDKKAPGMDWDRLLGAAQLGNQQDFIVWQPGADHQARRAGRLAAARRVEGLARLPPHQPDADVLPKAFDDAHFAFYGTDVNGHAAAAHPRQARADVDQRRARRRGRQALRREIFPRLVQGRHRRHGEEHQGRASTSASTRSTGWSRRPRRKRKKKVATMAVGIGYPDKWRDYGSLDIRADDAYGNLDRARARELPAPALQARQAGRQDEWWMTPQTVNAVNLPLQNALNFPAAILDKGFYDPKADAAANYGAIGSVIGHEISHSFDNLGATFDADRQAAQLVDPGRPRALQAGRRGAGRAVRRL